MTFPRKFLFYTVKLPFILMIIPLGFILEFFISLPFIVICSLDHRLQRWSETGNAPGADKSRGLS